MDFEWFRKILEIQELADPNLQQYLQSIKTHGYGHGVSADGHEVFGVDTSICPGGIQVARPSAEARE
jgi:hypothetical protein